MQVANSSDPVGSLVWNAGALLCWRVVSCLETLRVVIWSSSVVLTANARDLQAEIICGMTVRYFVVVMTEAVEGQDIGTSADLHCRSSIEKPARYSVSRSYGITS